jgi:FKBP-type peptidyl-prolyl cis-trans isomerase (trigger factor)
MKQTAVEWLIEQFAKYYAIHQLDEEIEQAKQMERQQNEYTWIAGAEYALSFLKDKTSEDSKESFEQYYNETYGGNK